MPFEVVSVGPIDDRNSYSEAEGLSFCSLLVFSPGTPAKDYCGPRLTLIFIGFFENTWAELLIAGSHYAAEV